MNNRLAKTILPFCILLSLTCLNHQIARCQDSARTNSILYASFFVGHAGGTGGGFSLGTEGAFQTGKSLFTLQLHSTLKLRTSFALYIFPLFEMTSSQQTISLLYGRRFIKEGMANSFSLGVSYNIFEELDDTASTGYRKTTTAGIPIEANIQWFKSEKKRFRIIYGLVPIGKPTGFGRSIGFKVFGNISKNSFAGIGVSTGLGFHKKY